ncbi:DNA alkylation repair protein [Comamonas sp. 26]|uniref:DNA alkylation repair protein n=1 Tax=Comamonas sp. 26 TaxID=2035201 RepID=UPI000C176F0E|nr:DNA alkylation repair protein [Comamonas sp. 26]PIG07913.1 DNA alkylation repair enzyme [Comamonas sp. 26]
MKNEVRKGATRAVDIPRDILRALSLGELQCATLAECLAVDQAVLARTIFPALTAPALNAIDAACQLGVLKRMTHIGLAMLEDLGTEGIAQCQRHRADMARGWACFMIGAQPYLDVDVRLAAIYPLADDAHFGVREWAWMAMRPHLVQELPTAIAQLMLWTKDPSERVRRFACEVLRPRGVWCTHISALKHSPEQALPLLSALRSDPSVYVQDSVANWLNDAAKDQPAWVRGICDQWLENSQAAATRRICQRALRNLK